MESPQGRSKDHRAGKRELCGLPCQFREAFLQGSDLGFVKEAGGEGGGLAFTASRMWGLGLVLGLRDHAGAPKP